MTCFKTKTNQSTLKQIIMKTSINIIAAALTVIVLFIGNSSFAQNKKTVDQTDGYFVLVSNKAEKKVTTVQFYNNANVLMYEEKVTGFKFNLNRKKTIDMLNLGLQKAILAFNSKPEVQKNQDWVAAIVKK